MLAILTNITMIVIKKSFLKYSFCKDVLFVFFTVYLLAYIKLKFGLMAWVVRKISVHSQVKSYHSLKKWYLKLPGLILGIIRHGQIGANTFLKCICPKMIIIAWLYFELSTMSLSKTETTTPQELPLKIKDKKFVCPNE